MVNNVEKRFHTSDCEIETISPLDENKKWMKDELNGKIMTEFLGLDQNLLMVRGKS